VTVVPHVLERKDVILFRKRQKNFHFLFMLSFKKGVILFRKRQKNFHFLFMLSSKAQQKQMIWLIFVVADWQHAACASSLLGKNKNLKEESRLLVKLSGLC
jgi:predicted nucleic acid-binding Zn ribbon protein